MLTTPQVIEILKGHSLQLQQDFGLEGLVLYGSYAQEKQGSGSDVDLLYELKEGYSMSLVRLQKLQQFVGNLLQVDKVETVNKQYVNPIIYSHLQKHAITIF